MYLALLAWVMSAPHPLQSGLHANRQMLGQSQQTLEQIMTAPRPLAPSDILNRELSRFRGKPVQYAFDRLGYPDKKVVIEGKIVYSWINVDTNRDGSPLRCTLKVITRAKRIIATDFFGNEGACERFAHSLDSSFRWP